MALVVVTILQWSVLSAVAKQSKQQKGVSGGENVNKIGTSSVTTTPSTVGSIRRGPQYLNCYTGITRSNHNPNDVLKSVRCPPRETFCTRIKFVDDHPKYGMTKFVSGCAHHQTCSKVGCVVSRTPEINFVTIRTCCCNTSWCNGQGSLDVERLTLAPVPTTKTCPPTSTSTSTTSIMSTQMTKTMSRLKTAHTIAPEARYQEHNQIQQRLPPTTKTTTTDSPTWPLYATTPRKPSSKVVPVVANSSAKSLSYPYRHATIWISDALLTFWMLASFSSIINP